MMNTAANASLDRAANCTGHNNISVEAKDYSAATKTSFGLIASLSFFGNLLLCLVIFMKRPMLKKPYNILIFNLAVADMLTGTLSY